MILIRDSTPSSTTIKQEHLGIYKIFTVKNVLTYTNCPKTFNSWNIETSEGVDDVSSTPIYFIADTHFNDAFSHWVFESAIYLILFSMLKEKYPSIQLVLKEKRTYKLLFCRLFGISEDDITYRIEPKNTSIFPSPISMLNCKEISTEYKEHLRAFYVSFTKYKSAQNHEIVILPRQTKENYKGNDRVYRIDALYRFMNDTKQSYEILNTDTIEDLTEQIYKVSSAKTILLTDGSPFFVNGMFAQNARILVIGNISVSQQSEYPKVTEIVSCISRFNSSTVKQFNTTEDLVEWFKTSI